MTEIYEPSFRLQSKQSVLVIYGDNEWATHLGREFYRLCLAAGLDVTAQRVMPGRRYVTSDEADALFRPENR